MCMTPESSRTNSVKALYTAFDVALNLSLEYAGSPWINIMATVAETYLSLAYTKRLNCCVAPTHVGIGARNRPELMTKAPERTLRLTKLPGGSERHTALPRAETSTTYVYLLHDTYR